MKEALNILQNYANCDQCLSNFNPLSLILYRINLIYHVMSHDIKFIFGLFFFCSSSSFIIWYVRKIFVWEPRHTDPLVKSIIPSDFNQFISMLGRRPVHDSFVLLNHFVSAIRIVPLCGLRGNGRCSKFHHSLFISVTWEYFSNYQP